MTALVIDGKHQHRQWLIEALDVVPGNDLDTVGLPSGRAVRDWLAGPERATELIVITDDLPDSSPIEMLGWFGTQAALDAVPVLVLIGRAGFDATMQASLFRASRSVMIDILHRPGRVMIVERVRNMLTWRRRHNDLRARIDLGRLPPGSTPLPVLPARARECLRAYCSGSSIPEIAAALAIKEKTVYNHLAIARRALAARNLGEACSRAALLELI